MQKLSKDMRHTVKQHQCKQALIRAQTTNDSSRSKPNSDKSLFFLFSKENPHSIPYYRNSENLNFSYELQCLSHNSYWAKPKFGPPKPIFYHFKTLTKLLSHIIELRVEGLRLITRITTSFLLQNTANNNAQQNKDQQ